jgi:hypothetical protein
VHTRRSQVVTPAPFTSRARAAGVVDPILAFHRVAGAALNPVTRIQLYKLPRSTLVDAILVSYMLNEESDQIGNLDALTYEPYAASAPHLPVPCRVQAQPAWPRHCCSSSRDSF